MTCGKPTLHRIDGYTVDKTSYGIYRQDGSTKGVAVKEK